MFGKERKVSLDDSFARYIVFGKGKKTLIMIPGLGEALKGLKGQAFILSLYYKKFAKDYTVYVIGRKEIVPQGYSTRDMANDVVRVLDSINIKNADIVGISQGGMIAQHIAINYPERVNKLVLGITISKPSETLQKVVNAWINMASNGDYKALISDTMEKTYTQKHYKKYKMFLPLITRIGKPKSFERFINQAYSCLNHNTYDKLFRIKANTLILGGDSDNVVGGDSSSQIAEKIPNNKFVLYKGLGHGAYEETKSFNKEIIDFLKLKWKLL